ncbi:hypothetical protein [Sinobacterium caligoides]|uniref:hypothetical protein n=1 Tax=Sinobacterium caligoides TaxID=933926 RepID=UPI0011CE6F36|nr:hypothetical protein [Sinobacterium caligoides]
MLELDGFLNAVRCFLDCPKRLFSAELVGGGLPLEDIVDGDIKGIETNGRVISKSIENYHSVYKLIVDLIYKKISKSKTRSTENIDWNLVEYYGLISTADIEDGPWNRLISQDHTLVRFLDEDGSESITFYIEFSDFVLATQLGVAWNE